MKNFIISFVKLYLILVSVMIFSSNLSASETMETDELSGLSLGSLLNMDISVATKTEMTLEDAPSVVSVITANEIKNMGARNIIDVLRTVPGFDLTHYMLIPLHELNVRGQHSSQDNNKINFMLNGHSMQAAWSSALAHFDTIPLANINKIEIIRGPGSALYGSGAFLSVINIITKQGGEEPSRVSAGYGSFGTATSYGEFSYGDEDFKTYLYADVYSTDGYKKTVDSDMATQLFTEAGSAAPGDITYSSEYYTLQADIRYKDFYFSGFFQELKPENAVGVSKALTDEDDMESWYAYGEFGYKFSLQDRGNLLIRAFYDQSMIDYEYEIFSEETAAILGGYPEGEGIHGTPSVDQTVWGAEVASDYTAYPGIQLAGGVSYEHFKQFNVRHHANSNYTGSPFAIEGITYAPFQYLDGFRDISEEANWNKDADRSVFALYFQGFIDLKELFDLEKGVERLSITSGVRYDDYDDTGSAASPRLGIVYAPTDDLYFKLLYGTAFRAPTLRELYNTNNPSEIGNENLKPEKCATIEAQIGYNFRENIKTSLTFFHIRTKDAIQAVPADIGNILENKGKIESVGAEAEFRVYLDKLKYLYCNATWQVVRSSTNETIFSPGGRPYTQDDFNPGNIPEFYGNIGVNYDFSKYVTGNVWVNYVGERERSEEIVWAGEKLVKQDTRDAVKARTLVNASLTFRNFCKGIEIQLSGFNLSDTDHRDPDPISALEHDLPRPGRSFTGRISYSF